MIHVRTRLSRAEQEARERARARAAWSAAPDGGDNSQARQRKRRQLDGTARTRVTPIHPSEVICGTNAMYQRGCRCERCKAASRDYKRELRARA
jgi:hypothetical protein